MQRHTGILSQLCSPMSSQAAGLYDHTRRHLHADIEQREKFAAWPSASIVKCWSRRGLRAWEGEDDVVAGGPDDGREPALAPVQQHQHQACAHAPNTA